MKDKLKKFAVFHFPKGVPENVSMAIQTGVLSLLAGLSAVLFMFMTNLLFEKTYLAFAGRSTMFFILASFLVIISTSTVVGLLLNVFSPDAAGSGIPQVKSAYWKELGHLKIKPVLIKFVAGILSIGGGNSLGREGPSVFIGSGVASNADGVFGTPKRGRRAAAVIGASAGLAAAFNAPLAAIAFVIEEIVGDLNNRYLGRVVLSSVIGAFVVYALIGRQPAFSLPAIDNISWLHYFIVPLVAFVAALAGVVFQRVTLLWKLRLKRQKRIPAWLLPVLGGLATWIIGCGVFLATGKLGVFGLGYQDLSNALNNHFEWKIAGVMIVAKLLAMIIGYSFGGCGGIFAPLLFVGGMTGYFLGGLARVWIPLTPADQIVLAVIGMSACLGATVRAPLTSILIVFEMTHQFSLVPSLLLATIISQATARFAGKLNFYDALLVQDGHELHKIHPPVDLNSWQNLPVSAIANPTPVMLSGLAEDEMRDKLDRFPFNSFPLLVDGRIKGIVTRQQMQQAVLVHGVPEIHKAALCYPEQTVREIGSKFLESSAYVLVVVDRGTKTIRGIITLHDLIRAQAAIQH
ncbi:MAG: chloride channel protein [Candidatus Aminicenantes bacterium]|nr:chloride channel protein [Candidatus Aminicenantes bacterium]